MRHSVAIRAYEESDLDALAHLWLDSWKSTGPPIAGLATVEELRERIPSELRSGWSVFLACVKTDLIGFVALKEVDQCLDQLFVAPRHQGRGIGKILLAFAKHRMPTGFSLRTALANRRACEFYEREGFVRGGVTPHPRLGHPTLIYRWRLAALQD